MSDKLDEHQELPCPICKEEELYFTEDAVYTEGEVKWCLSCPKCNIMVYIHHFI